MKHAFNIQENYQEQDGNSTDDPLPRDPDMIYYRFDRDGNASVHFKF